jgi:hypothetical protein
MRPTMYLTFSLLSAVVMTVSAYPAVPTAVAVESSVSSRPTAAEGLVKLALYKKAYWCEFIGDCDDDDDGD